jgi:hypothetical protein
LGPLGAGTFALGLKVWVAQQANSFPFFPLAKPLIRAGPLVLPPAARSPLKDLALSRPHDFA